MDRRRLLLLVPAGVLGAGLAGAAAWLGLHGDKRAAGIGGPFRLSGTDGREVTDADFRGRWMLVYFGYTKCPDACPTALQDMANAVDSLDADMRAKVAMLFITVNPEHDTPTYSEPQSSARGIAIIGRPCPRSLQRP